MPGPARIKLLKGTQSVNGNGGRNDGRHSLIKYLSTHGDELFVRLYSAQVVRSHAIPQALQERLSDLRLKLLLRVAGRYQRNFSNYKDRLWSSRSNLIS